MIILPDRHRYAFLPDLPTWEWREPSAAQERDQFGEQNRTFFRLRARTHDGVVRWTGVFDSREDADAFLDALARYQFCGTPFPRALHGLCIPSWHPDLSGLIYEFATVVLLTTGAGNSWSVVGDWNNASNSIECIGGGGSGGAQGVSGVAGGGGQGGSGGAYAKIVNQAITLGPVAYQIASGGAAVTATGTQTIAGNDGGDTWFGNSVFASAWVGAKGGVKGDAGTTAKSATSGGQASASIGSTKYNGGGSGSIQSGSSQNASGGGGAAGPSGAGGNSSNCTANSNSVTGGGSANNGTTAGGSGTNNGTVGNGSSANEFGAGLNGSGSGGGGSIGAGGGRVGGNGGSYGGGGGGVQSFSVSTGTITSGIGRQGAIAITYTPTIRFFFPVPHMGF